MTSAADLAGRIEELRDVVDQGLERPARWRGPLRRGFTRGQDDPDEVARVATAFDRLAAGAPGPMDADDLAALHAAATGGDGFRTRPVRVGGPDRPPEPVPPADRVRDAVDAALARSRDGTEAPPLAAARMHLELLRIHPFLDGNGRTARLAASGVLIEAGYRSTLFTAVEQHFHATPWAYGEAFAVLRDGGWTDLDGWLATVLGAAAGRVTFAAWWRARGLPPAVLERDRRYRRWRRRYPRNAAELDDQVGRLRAELAEASEASLTGS